MSVSLGEHRGRGLRQRRQAPGTPRRATCRATRRPAAPRVRGRESHAAPRVRGRESHAVEAVGGARGLGENTAAPSAGRACSLSRGEGATAGRGPRPRCTLPVADTRLCRVGFTTVFFKKPDWILFIPDLCPSRETAQCFRVVTVRQTCSQVPPGMYSPGWVSGNLSPPRPLRTGWDSRSPSECLLGVQGIAAKHRSWQTTAFLTDHPVPDGAPQPGCSKLEMRLQSSRD